MTLFVTLTDNLLSNVFSFLSVFEWGILDTSITNKADRAGYLNIVKQNLAFIANPLTLNSDNINNEDDETVQTAYDVFDWILQRGFCLPKSIHVTSEMIVLLEDKKFVTNRLEQITFWQSGEDSDGLKTFIDVFWLTKSEEKLLLNLKKLHLNLDMQHHHRTAVISKELLRVLPTGLELLTLSGCAFHITFMICAALKESLKVLKIKDDLPQYDVRSLDTLRDEQQVYDIGSFDPWVTRLVSMLSSLSYIRLKCVNYRNVLETMLTIANNSRSVKCLVVGRLSSKLEINGNEGVLYHVNPKEDQEAPLLSESGFPQKLNLGHRPIRLTEVVLINAHNEDLYFIADHCPKLRKLNFLFRPYKQKYQQWCEGLNYIGYKLSNTLTDLTILQSSGKTAQDVMRCFGEGRFCNLTDLSICEKAYGLNEDVVVDIVSSLVVLKRFTFLSKQDTLLNIDVLSAYLEEKVTNGRDFVLEYTFDKHYITVASNM